MPITDERALSEKLLRIEALHAGATTPGERAAAANAMDRIRERLKKVAVQDPASRVPHLNGRPLGERAIPGFVPVL